MIVRLTEATSFLNILFLYFYIELRLHAYIFYNNNPRVLCLCEAPGGFAECIHYIFPQAKLKVQSKLDSYIQFSKKIPKALNKI